MLLLLKKIKRKLFSSYERKILNERIQILTKNGWTVQNTELEKIIINNNFKTIELRNSNSTDFNVFKQVMIQEEYKPMVSFFLDNKIELNTMIDAGANIGLTSIYFKNYFPNLKIVCIEPDSNNYKLLNTNISNYDDIKVCKAGLLGKDNLSLSIGTDFRGGGDWAKQIIVANEKTDLLSITIPKIQTDFYIDIIDLLKIDIEGAETFLVEAHTDTSFLNKTRCIAIEIHDEYNCRKEINELLVNFGFILLNVGETTFAFNKHLILNDY